MFVTALLLGLVGVFCILDSRILGRMNFERPLITCTIVGALLGDLQTGLTLGASIELMSLGIVNIGAAAPPDMNMAAIICAAFAILTDASAETALALAIPIAVLGQMLGVLMRTILSNLTHVADHAIAEGKFRKAWSIETISFSSSAINIFAPNFIHLLTSKYNTNFSTIYLLSRFLFCVRLRAFLRLSVSATYSRVLKHPVCGFPHIAFVPVFLKCPISLLLRGQTYIPYSPVLSLCTPI